MKARSFRFRIVVWSVLVSGAILIAFSWVTWLALQQIRMESLDESLAAFGFRHATQASRNVETARIESSMVENFGEAKAAKRFFALLTEEGELLYRSAHWPNSLKPAAYPGSDTLLDPQPNIPAPPNRQGPERGKGGRRDRPVMEPLYYTEEGERKEYRLGTFANHEVKLVIGADLSEVSAEMGSLRRAFLIALPGALFLVASGAWLIAKRAIRPVETLRRDMEMISAEALDGRLEVAGAAEEFTGIVEQYNAMLERLERSFHQAKRFSADASHELKTPLAVMRASLESALSESGNDPERQAIFSELLEQTDRQKAILENLLLLSRADSGHLEIGEEAVDLSGAIATWMEDADFLAEGRNISIESKIEPGIHVRGDHFLLQQVAHNLFSNAVRHNVDNGSIDCVLSRSGAQAEWRIANTGPLIHPAETEKVFERFFCGRATAASGTGLGLSLVQEIVSAHGGRITFSTNNQRNVFRVLLPIITPR